MASKSASRALTDHDEIRRWAEERGATPTAVRRTESEEDVGIIRLDFPGYSGAGSLDEISWDEWFDKFDEKNLALLVQDQMADGKASNFNKLVSRDTVEEHEDERRERSRGRSTRSPASRQTQKGKSAQGTRTASKKSSRSERSTAKGSTKKKSASARRGSHRRAA